MKVYYSLEDLPAFQNTVVTIGSFDGVHCGHQHILERVKQLSQSVDSQSVVITFNPHPRLVAQPNDKSVVLLNSVEEKVDLLEKYGIDVVVVVPFTKSFSEQTPEAYIENFLYKLFKPTYIVIGYDHRFGANRVGDTDFLRSLSPKFGYEVIEIEKQVIDDIAVSSTKIRKAIEATDIKTATRLLGHYFSFTGEVVKGQQIGREIGFPTANLQVTERNKLLPPHGIYTVLVHLPDGKVRQGMMYRGDRPVLKEHDNITIEVNIFDFKDDIYGQKMKVEIVEFIRPDRYFDSLESLVIQLADDERASREILQAIENQKIPRVAIVILNWNTPQYLKLFLPSVCGSRYGNFDVIVADNGSTDNSIETVRELNLDGIPAAMGVDRVKVVELKENYGFAKGYNMALKHEKLRPRSKDTPNGYDYYVLLNSDCRTSQGWLTPIISMMEKDRAVAAVQPKVLSYNKKRKFEYAGAGGGWLDALGYPFSRGRVFDNLEKDRKQYDDEAEIFWASGAAMVVRADLWHRFGGFDEDFWAHMEEIDVCWRMKRAGYKVMVQPKGVVRHVGGGTMDYLSPRKTYLNFRNSLYTLLKNEPLSKLLWLIPLRLVLDGVAGVKFLFDGQRKHVWSIMKAHFSFYGNFFYMLKKRRETAQLIEKERIAPENRAGILRGSIVWQYYVNKKTTFSEIVYDKKEKIADNENDENE
ncbi:MAG: bifunctional riboflavin kinase/FAD synthetase [Saprospiraceae bacterium]|nr:bifunctional riboflavin kinase/FAD synthetase [Saprospiraceae bacterium]